MKSFAQLARTNGYWLTHLQVRLFGTVEKFRTDRGWTRTQLAEHLGVSKGYVSQILNGDFDHRLSKLIQLSLAVGVVPDIQFTPVDEYVQEYLSGEAGVRDVRHVTATIVVQLPATPTSPALPIDLPSAVQWRASTPKPRYEYA